MDDIKARFLWELGIRKDNYPNTFLDTIQDVSKLVTNVELGYCAVETRCDGQPGMFCIKDVVGTDHPRYAGRSWIDAFLDLDRGDNIIRMYEENPSYWDEIKDIENTDIGLLKYGDKYYIFSKAGGGNNRLITMKIRYLALIHQAGDDQDEIEKINKQFTFSANIRELPIEKTIPFIVVAMSEDLSGLSARKKGDKYIVTKKFTDLELFNGDEAELIEYFRSLFRTDIYGEDEVKSRLASLERGCKISPKEFRIVLEGIIPQLKNSKEVTER